jgi:hypothetical protein
MAAKKCNTAPGIVIADSQYWTKYRGTKEALIAAGICTEEQFPVTPKRMREGDMDSLTDGWRLRRHKGGVFELMRWHERREKPRPPLRESPEQFREWLAQRARLFVDVDLKLDAVHVDTGEPLTFSEESRKAILDAADTLAQTIRSARVETTRRSPKLTVVRVAGRP